MTEEERQLRLHALRRDGPPAPARPSRPPPPDTPPSYAPPPKSLAERDLELREIAAAQRERDLRLREVEAMEAQTRAIKGQRSTGCGSIALGVFGGLALFVMAPCMIPGGLIGLTSCEARSEYEQNKSREAAAERLRQAEVRDAEAARQFAEKVKRDKKAKPAATPPSNPTAAPTPTVEPPR